MEYIITEYTNMYGWCLLYTLGKRTADSAFEELKKMEQKHPDKILRVQQVADKDCWWNDPFLAN